MRSIIFKRQKGTQEIQKIRSQSFKGSHLEDHLHKFLEQEPSLIARGVAHGEPLPTLVIATRLPLTSGELDLM